MAAHRLSSARSSTRVALFVLIASAPAAFAMQSGSDCQPGWLPTFGGAPGFDNGVVSSFVFDDGSGPALYVGGAFVTAGGVPANRIAKRTGSTWAALGSGMDNDPNAFAVFDDGSGPALYAGGYFTTAGGIVVNHVAKWNGSTWSALGSGTGGAFNYVKALAVFDDGSGPALYVGGGFATAGGVAAPGIAKWNGSSWSGVGTGMNGSVDSLAVFDDGSGPALYAGGGFTTAGGVAANRIARWDGSTWSPLGTAMAVGYLVSALTVFDDGSGPALFAGGNFPTAGGVTVNNIAKWDGSGWSALGSGVIGSGLNALAVFDDGSGPALYAGGYFLSASGVPVSNIARWNGSSWSALGSGVDNSVYAITVFDDGSGPALYPGGVFFSAGGVAANRIAKWSGSAWSALGSGFSSTVAALRVLDVGSGPALYAGGDFTSVPGLQAAHVAKWDGSTWSAMNGITGPVSALAMFDDGSGPAVYAGGGFTNSGALRRIAKWNGASWSPLGIGMENRVNALTVFDDGNGPALYAAGAFDRAGDVSALRIAKWNGTTWSPLGSGLGAPGYFGASMAVFDDGTGPALYVGGFFPTAGGVAAACIAKWDGSAWSPLGSGMNGPVLALQVSDVGGGPALYAGGDFSIAGGVPANGIAKWNGASWSALGTGVNGDVYSLTEFNDGSEAALVAGGQFGSAGGVAASRIARWDGSSWSALGSGANHTVYAVTEFDDGGGASLFAGGSFASAPDSQDSYLAKWGCTQAGPGSTYCFGDGSGAVIACPCDNTGSLGHGCANSQFASRGARLSSFGATNPDTVTLTSSEERPEALSIFLQGNVNIVAGLPYGDGIRCAGGAIKRLYKKNASHGTVSAPGPGDLPIRARSAAAGDTIPAGATRYYQVYYRDPAPTFCPSPPGNTWNVSNGIAIVWP